MQKLIAGVKGLGLELTSAQIEQFQIYYEELTDWNRRINLTAITDYREVQIKHFLDSLTVSLAMPQPVPPGLKLIDVGSGGGLPGLPLKIIFPQLSLTLLESTGKKAEFLKHLVGKLSLSGIEIITGRAEEVTHQADYREHFDAVVARGVAEMPVLVELTLPFCRIGGYLIAQKKSGIDQELALSQKAMQLMGGSLAEVKEIKLPEFPDGRCLVLVKKVSATPARYPRRAGMPAKRPFV